MQGINYQGTHKRSRSSQLAPRGEKGTAQQGIRNGKCVHIKTRDLGGETGKKHRLLCGLVTWFEVSMPFLLHCKNWHAFLTNSGLLGSVSLLRSHQQSILSSCVPLLGGVLFSLLLWISFSFVESTMKVRASWKEVEEGTILLVRLCTILLVRWCTILLVRWVRHWELSACLQVPDCWTFFQEQLVCV